MNIENPANAPAVPDGRNDDAGFILGKDITIKRFRECLAFLFLLGLAIRIGFLLEHAHNPSFGVPTLDQKYYDTVARMLLAGRDLHELHGFRPLLYPMFLAVWYKLGGSWGVDLAIFVQHVLGVATGLIVALLGARLFRHRLSGVVGGGLYLLAPLPLCFEGELLIESSYTFLICLALLLHLHTARTTGWKSGLLWLLCGGLTILISQARANIVIFLAVYPLFAAWRWWRLRQWAAMLPLLGLAGALGMAIPWGIINMRQSDHFNLMPNQSGVNLYLGNKRTADGMIPRQDRRISSNEGYQDSVEVWAREEYEAAMRAQGQEPEKDPMAISRFWTRRAMDEIEASPVVWLRLIAKKSWLMFWNAEVPNNKAFAFLQEEFFWLRILPVRWVVLLMLAPAGIWAAAKWGNRDGLFILFVYVCLYSAGIVAFFICDRYRYPVWPAMAAIGGGGLLASLGTIRLRKPGQVSCILAGMALMAAISLHNWFGTKLPSYARDFLFRSFAWYEKGHFQEALDDVNRSIELDSADPTALHHRGNVLFKLNRLEEARDAYLQTLTVSPGETRAWNNLGETFDTLGGTEQAMQAFHRAAECLPPSKNAFLNMSFIYIRLGQLDEATAWLDQLEKLNRGPEATTLAIRSVIERRRGNSQSATAFEQRARAMDPAATTWAIERATKVGH